MTEDVIGINYSVCDACKEKSVKVGRESLGKDFFGRPYDRLTAFRSPSKDIYLCDICSSEKDLQKDYRDIKKEFEKMKNVCMEKGFGISEIKDETYYAFCLQRLEEIIDDMGKKEYKQRLLNIEDAKKLRDDMSIWAYDKIFSEGAF